MVELPLMPLSRALRLTIPLAFIAGIVDVVGFVSLFGMFTSHFTGNFVVVGKEIVDHSLRLIAELIALPVFAVVVAMTRIVALRYERKDRSALPTLLLIQTALLAGCMLMGVSVSPVTNPAAISAILASQLGVAAMAVQNAYGRLVFRAHATTTVMTTNTTQAAIDFVDMYRGVPGLSEQARDRFERTAPIILAFVAGVVAGAYGYLVFSFWCLTIPVAGLLVVRWIVASVDDSSQSSNHRPATGFLISKRSLRECREI
jgi:uncharacterized membrane protein YoaK (UPF0700 family)